VAAAVVVGARHRLARGPKGRRFSEAKAAEKAIDGRVALTRSQEDGLLLTNSPATFRRCEVTPERAGAVAATKVVLGIHRSRRLL